MTMPAASATDQATIQSDVLGQISLPTTELWHFPVGVYGFPNCKDFALVPSGRDGVFWLQSATHRQLAFLLIDPFLFFEGYSIELSPADLSRIGTSEQKDIVVLAIVTLPSKREDPWTANLQGPIVLNQRDRHGLQCVISSDTVGTREAFNPL